MSFVYVEGQGEGDGKGSTGRGEEGAGSAVNARQHNTWSSPSKTADATHDFPADPMLDCSKQPHLSLPTLNPNMESSGEYTAGLANGGSSRALLHGYMPLPPPFLFTFSSIIILLCILSVLMKTYFVQHCILINQISKINK